MDAVSHQVIHKNAKGGQMLGEVGSLDSAKGSDGHKPAAVAGEPPAPGEAGPNIEDVHVRSHPSHAPTYLSANLQSRSY